VSAWPFPVSVDVSGISDAKMTGKDRAEDSKKDFGYNEKLGLPLYFIDFK
jgi:hypothetical protein